MQQLVGEIIYILRSLSNAGGSEINSSVEDNCNGNGQAPPSYNDSLLTS